jgi:peptide/nickel transport system permease protein
MWRYILRRLLYFIPTLLVISLLAFALSKMAPGDPVEMLLRGESNFQTGPLGEVGVSNRLYRQTAANLGLDKPAFYLSLMPASYPDTLSRILIKDQRQTLRKLVARHGHWPLVQAYFHRLIDWENQLFSLPDSLETDPLVQLRKQSRRLYFEYEDRNISLVLDQLSGILAEAPGLNQVLQPAFANLQETYRQIVQAPLDLRRFLPRVYWHGLDNQYHHWMAGFLRGDFGISYYYKQPVSQKIWEALGWTVLLNGSAILLAYLIALPIGVWAGARAGSRFDRTSSTALFMLYSLPSFWIATLLLVFFTNGIYGMDWFPAGGVGRVSEAMSFWERLSIRVHYFFLPVVCLTYGALAFISRQMRQDYIRTARAKGLPENRVIWKHAFRNALFPIITLLAGLLPALLAGSVAIEVIFSIPGMGRLTIDSIVRKDWPVVYAILMLAAILTMIGILLADLLYAWADPRVRLGGRSNRQ